MQTATNVTIGISDWADEDSETVMESDVVPVRAGVPLSVAWITRV